MLRSFSFRSRAAGEPADTDRTKLIAFVEAGELAKAAYERGEITNAHRLYGDAIQKAAPIAKDQRVIDVLNTFRQRYEETRPGRAQNSVADQFAQAVRELVVTPSADLTWDSVVGLEDAKRALQESVVLPGLNPELFTGLRSPPKGILLYGPPGNGKTLLAKVAASQCRATFFSVSASSLTSKWHGETEKILKALFTVAHERAPSAVFIDELDSVLSARSNSESETARRLKTEFLVQLDGLTPVAGGNRSGHVVVLGATNRPFDLDDAVMRRFPVRIHLPLPDHKVRIELVKSLIAQQSNRLSSREIDEIARKTERFSSSDIANLCREASMVAVRELSSAQVAQMQAAQIRAMTSHDFAQALRQIQASVSVATVDELSRWEESVRR